MYETIKSDFNTEMRIRKKINAKNKKYSQKLYKLNNDVKTWKGKEIRERHLAIILFLDICKSLDLTWRPFRLNKSMVENIKYIFRNYLDLYSYLPPLFNSYYRGSKYETAVHILVITRKIKEKIDMVCIIITYMYFKRFNIRFLQIFVSTEIN